MTHVETARSNATMVLNIKTSLRTSSYEEARKEVLIFNTIDAAEWAVWSSVRMVKIYKIQSTDNNFLHVLFF